MESGPSRARPVALGHELRDPLDGGTNWRCVDRLVVCRGEERAQLRRGSRAIEKVPGAVETGLDEAAVAGEQEALVVQAEAERQGAVRWPARPQAEVLNGHAEAPAPAAGLGRNGTALWVAREIAGRRCHDPLRQARSAARSRP